MDEKLMLYENNLFIDKCINAQSREIYLKFPKNKIVLGKKDLISPNKKYSAVEFWSVYNYLSALIYFNTSWGMNVVTLSKHQILYELGCPKPRLKKSTPTDQMQKYLELICDVLKYMNDEEIISYLPSNLKELNLSQPFQFVTNNHYMHIDFKGDVNYVVLYPFEYYTIFGNNPYPAKTRLELLNLYLCIKAYGKQSKEHYDVCCKSKRSLSNLTGISQRVVDSRYKMLINLNLIASYIMYTEIEKSILVTVPSNTEHKYVINEITKHVKFYYKKYGYQKIRFMKNVPFVDNRKKEEPEEELNGEELIANSENDNDENTSNPEDVSNKNEEQNKTSEEAQSEMIDKMTKENELELLNTLMA